MDEIDPQKEDIIEAGEEQDAAEQHPQSTEDQPADTAHDDDAADNEGTNSSSK